MTFFRTKAVLIFGGFALRIGAVFAQQPLEFGNVPMASLTADRCEIDSSASAVILFDVVKVDLRNHYKYERHVRIKFMNHDAIDAWANVNLDYVKGLSVTNIRGATYNVVGGQIVSTQLDRKDIFETQISRGLRRVSFALPKVTVGSVVEYSYTTSFAMDLQMSNVVGAVFGVNFVDLSWEFQQNIPAYWCGYSFTGWYSSYLIQGSIPIGEDKREAKQGFETHQWIFKNVPAFKKEPNSLPKVDLVGKLFIDLTEQKWPRIAGNFNNLKKYGWSGNDSSLVKHLAERFKAIPNYKVKVDSIVSFVKRKIKWTGEVDRYPDRKFGQVYIAGAGSSSEINSFIAALLNKAGLQSYPVMISTRDNGTISEDRPSITELNSLITGVTNPQSSDKKQEILLLDGTDKYLSSEYLPLRCLNGLGLLIDRPQSRLIPLDVPKSKTSISANLHINESDKLVNGELELGFYGVYASEERNSYFSLGQNKYEEKLSTIYPDKIDKMLASNLNNNHMPMKIAFKISRSDLVKFSGDFIYLNPLSIINPEENLFKSETRRLPIDLSPMHERIYTIAIEIPENYSVEELPKSGASVLPGSGAKFFYNLSQQGSILHITFRLTFDKTVFSAQEYPVLRAFYNLILQKHDEPLVLKKK